MPAREGTAPWTQPAGIDTGAFLLAHAGLLEQRRATVHYEHIDAFAENYPGVEVVEDLYVIDRQRGTCSGGVACIDLALEIIRGLVDAETVNAVARYMFHDRVRRPGEKQGPRGCEPIGFRAPEKLRRAIHLMEENLEDPLTIPAIADQIGLSQRQLERLFKAHARISAVRYYRNARLDRARGLITQTDLSVLEVALASGFPTPENYSRAYRQRFGLAPRTDKVQGRVPFEFRAWPMHTVSRPQPRDGSS